VAHDFPTILSRRDGVVFTCFERPGKLFGVIEAFDRIFVAVYGMKKPAYSKCVFRAEKMDEKPFSRGRFTFNRLDLRDFFSAFMVHSVFECGCTSTGRRRRRFPATVRR